MANIIEFGGNKGNKVVVDNEGTKNTTNIVFKVTEKELISINENIVVSPTMGIKVV